MSRSTGGESGFPPQDKYLLGQKRLPPREQNPDRASSLPWSGEIREILLPCVDSRLGVCSPLFMVRKKSDAWRPVLGLKHLKRFFKGEKLKMEILFSF